VGITRFLIWGPKSRSVHNSSQRSDFGLLGLILDNFSQCDVFDVSQMPSTRFRFDFCYLMEKSFEK
jgi:hypothetical protein